MLKKVLLILIKAIVRLLLILVLIVTLGILWPLPELNNPEKYETLLVTSINIIDIKSGNVLYNRDILIEDNKIKSIHIASSKDVKVDLIIDGTGKFAIPGLWDMHTHSNQLSEWLHHPLYIANGVTGVRDMSGQLHKKDSYWAGSRERMQWNKDLDDYIRTTPRYVLQSSYQLDGASSVPDNFPEYFKLQNPEDIDSVLNFYKQEKVDFLKVYSQIPPKSFKKLAQQAPKYGMHLAGHKPIYVSLGEAISLGQKSFEHGRVFMLEAFPNADSLRLSKNWRDFFMKSRKSMVNDFNPKVAKSLMESMRDNGAYWTPTLQTLKFEAYAHKATFLENENLKYISSARKRLWWNYDIAGMKKRNLSPEHKGISLQFYKAAKEQVKMAKEVGVPIMAGTDVTDSYTFAGFSIHDELKELTDSGLTNLEALQSATIIPAKYANMDKNFGTIEVGKNADLVILDKNPLQEITNSKTILGVMINGIYYDSNKIEELKSYAENAASSFHMNTKIMYGFLKSPLIRVQFAD